MKKCILLLVSATLSFVLCNQEPAVAQPYPTTSNIVKLTDKNMPAVEYFSVKKINLPEEYAHAEYHVYNDSIVIIVNNKYPDPYFVTIYNLNTKKEIAGYFKKGNGPDELISASGKMYLNNLILIDGSTHAVTRLNIDSVLTKGYAYKPAITITESIAQSYVFLDDNTITSGNNMYISDDYGVDGIPEFVQYDAKTGKHLADYKQNDKNFPPNLTGRSIAYCNSKYIAFWYCFPIITIYDKDFNLLKMYRDDKFKDPEVADGKLGQRSSVLSVNGFASFFAFSCQTDNCIFVTNYRSYISVSDAKSKGGAKWVNSADFTRERCKDTELWCFDNDMNLVRRLKCSGNISLIQNVSYNEKTKTLFINAKDEDDEYCLYKCIFKK